MYRFKKQGRGVYTTLIKYMKGYHVYNQYFFNYKGIPKKISYFSVEKYGLQKDFCGTSVLPIFLWLFNEVSCEVM